MSAIGSVIVIAAPPSPARLGHTGDLPSVDHHPQADPAQSELAEHGLWPATPLASGISANLELGNTLLLLDECLLRHDAYRVSCRVSCLKGKPNALNSARPSSSLRAVVTIVTSIP